MIIELPDFIGFEWDAGNKDKSQIKHGVSNGESEQLFFNRPFVLLEDQQHSRDERRLFGFGRTDEGRKLLVVFTIRNRLIRVISARDMKRKERKFYDAYEKESA